MWLVHAHRPNSSRSMDPLLVPRKLIRRDTSSELS
jgi:hypothetical protein